MLLDSGAATAGRLSELMGLTSGAVTRVIDRLEQAGYVRRIPDPADRRRVIVELVPEKMAAIQATMASSATRARPRSERYSDAELAVIDDFLTRMAGGHARRGQRPARRARPRGGRAVGIRRPDRRPEPRPPAVPVGRQRAPGPRHRPTSTTSTAPSSTGRCPQVRLRDGIVTIQYKGRLQWDWRERRADVALNASVPWDVEVDRRGEQAPGQARVDSTCGHSR